MELIQLNRDPKLSDFSKDDLVLNTVTGDLFARTNNKLFKIISRNQFDFTTTDQVLKLISEAQDNDTGALLNGFQFTDGFYRVLTSSPLTGSNVSLHGGIPFDYGQPLPNAPYLKSNGGFDILLDNAGVNNNSSFRVFKDTGIASPTLGVELLKVDDDGNLTVKGTISGSTVATTNIDGGSF